MDLSSFISCPTFSMKMGTKYNFANFSQCLVSEKELNEATNNQVPLIVTCLDMLKKYSMVSSLYPGSSLLKHRCASYKRWIHMMLEFPSPNV